MLDFIKSLLSGQKASGSLIITAQITGLEKHPNADRLQLVRLNTSSTEYYPVVCGANNITVGDTVVLALPGATIAHNLHDPAHGSFVLEKARIRGTESQGMICAGFELGVTTKPEQGVLILKPGTPLGVALKSEYILQHE